MISNGRHQGLDVLRFVAVLLVLLHHSPVFAWVKCGWMGVDLFFALSGLLITNLLLREKAVRGRVDIKRFLFRRGWKIYPAFWLMLLATVVFRLWHREPALGKALLFELLFLQNYGPGLWVHTWSLAVEEHFYLALALGFWFLQTQPRRTALRARYVWQGGILALVLILLVRCATYAWLPHRYKFQTFGTHVRIDGLLAGALLAYWVFHHAERNAKLRTRVLTFTAVILAGVFLVVATVIQRQEHWLAHGLTYTLCYLGFSLFVWVFLPWHEGPSHQVWRQPWRGAAWMGRHSYAIYLWHLLVISLAHAWLKQLTFWYQLTMYFALTFGVGIAFSLLLDGPVLRLRDRWVPAKAAEPFLPTKNLLTPRSVQSANLVFSLPGCALCASCLKCLLSGPSPPRPLFRSGRGGAVVAGKAPGSSLFPPARRRGGQGERRPKTSQIVEF